MFYSTKPFAATPVLKESNTKQQRNMETTLTLYDPDLPVQMKNGMVLLKETVKNIKKDETTFEKLSNVVVELDREFTYGLNDIKNNGYITERMANGEETPDWVPIKKEQAIREALDFLKNDPNINKNKNALDKRRKTSFSEEVWQEKQNERKEKANEKKRKLETYDDIVFELESYKEKARSYKNKFLRCKAYFVSQNMDIPE